ncbi:MAG: (2Fe-2S)-binding protein, partial [Synergistaceae bacterium]|nr:(2Fe-2S)-binding protein [Synergistaceae bacterium]
SKLLSSYLRDDLGLLGTRTSCEAGECGVCTVLVNGKAVNSCLTLVSELSGAQVTTIEGLSDGAKLHPLQKAFIELDAVQCGYCTPGMIMAAHALLNEIPNPSEDEIKHALAGNFCRCTGYSSIVSAVKKAAAERGASEP